MRNYAARLGDFVPVFVLSTAIALRGQVKLLDFFWNSSIGMSEITLVIMMSIILIFGLLQPATRDANRRTTGLQSNVMYELNMTFYDLLEYIRLENRSPTANEIEWMRRLNPDSGNGDHRVRKLDQRDLAIHIWRVRRRKTFFVRLERYTKIRLETYPSIPSIRYTKTKGVIGHCWKTGKEASADILREFGSVMVKNDWNTLTKEVWKELPKEIKRGLSFQEFSSSTHCGAILAMPVKDDEGSLRDSIISVDLRFGFDILERKEVRSKVQDLGTELAKMEFG